MRMTGDCGLESLSNSDGLDLLNRLSPRSRDSVLVSLPASVGVSPAKTLSDRLISVTRNGLPPTVTPSQSSMGVSSRPVPESPHLPVCPAMSAAPRSRIPGRGCWQGRARRRRSRRRLVCAATESGAESHLADMTIEDRGERSGDYHDSGTSYPHVGVPQPLNTSVFPTSLSVSKSVEPVLKSVAYNGRSDVRDSGGQRVIEDRGGVAVTRSLPSESSAWRSMRAATRN